MLAFVGYANPQQPAEEPRPRLSRTERDMLIASFTALFVNEPFFSIGAILLFIPVGIGIVFIRERI